MIAANGVTARYLSAKKFPSIRRVVRTPKRWERIVEIAADHKFQLPELPNSKALEEFLVKQKAVDPLRFPDLSLAVIKLLGAGEYVAELPDGNVPGHFGLAVKDYAHSTAPNRRYPDLLTQRLLKAALAGEPVPYTVKMNWMFWRLIVPKLKMQPIKLNGRSENPLPRFCLNRESESSLIRSSPALPRKEPGFGCSTFQLKEN